MSQLDAMMGAHEKRMNIRRAIQKGGHKLFESFIDLPILQNIAGEFQSLNEDWAMNHEGTYGYDHLMKIGYSHNQVKWLTLIAEAMRQRGRS